MKRRKKKGEEGRNKEEQEMRKREQREKKENFGKREEMKREEAQKLEEEERKRREEERLRREEKEAKEEEERKKREEKEEEERKKEFQLRTEQLNLERERLKQAADTRRLQDEERATRKSLANRIKFFNDALKGTVGRMPLDAAMIPAYFSHLERLYDTINVDQDVRPAILLSNLSDKARALTSRLTTEQLGSYTAIK